MIGGKVLDASFVAALVRGSLAAGVLLRESCCGSLAAGAWLDTARLAGLALYLPTLALTEVRAVCSDAGAELAELLGHPGVVLGDLDAAAAAQVEQLLTEAGVFDALAGHVVHVARKRGWPVLSADPDRLRRIAPDLDLDML